MPSSKAQAVICGESQLRRGRRLRAQLGYLRAAGCSERRVRRAADRRRRHQRRTAGRRRVRSEKTQSGESAVAKHHRHGEVGSLVERGLCAQAIDRQPPLQIAEARRLPRRARAPRPLDHHEVVQVLALRGEQRRIARRVRTDLLDVVRDEPLQKDPAVRPRDGKNAPVFEQSKAGSGMAREPIGSA